MSVFKKWFAENNLSFSLSTVIDNINWNIVGQITTHWANNNLDGVIKLKGKPYTFEDESSRTIKPGDESLAMRDISRMHEVANKKVLELKEQNLLLKKALKYKNMPTREELYDIADRCRFQNNNLNYSKIGKMLGKSNKTAKDWCKHYRIE